ncbi:hypothetical protein HYDPIDRAFT_112559 [Hydnomerulius pinastri MD-312]|uniref:Unplaced genomic scaffold scaffold_14, whole genome shotgun sequence n=1 Tax=Hydnomerulius pinastri MD-312 TaxID=994086 RepID=A0A0C9WF99_9AGAM|nr:hypothetical protein HYDPIDRAFT_112559 [Hydnomerulius pinastri MD-312]
MPINVFPDLAPHTYFDDIESFFYGLMLFFISYNGFLREDTGKGSTRGFRRVRSRVESAIAYHPLAESVSKWAGKVFTAVGHKDVFIGRPILRVVDSVVGHI